MTDWVNRILLEKAGQRFETDDPWQKEARKRAEELWAVLRPEIERAIKVFTRDLPPGADQVQHFPDGDNLELRGGRYTAKLGLSTPPKVTLEMRVWIQSAEQPKSEAWLTLVTVYGPRRLPAIYVHHSHDPSNRRVVNRSDLAEELLKQFLTKY